MRSPIPRVESHPGNVIPNALQNNVEMMGVVGPVGHVHPEPFATTKIFVIRTPRVRPCVPQKSAVETAAEDFVAPVLATRHASTGIV